MECNVDNPLLNTLVTVVATELLLGLKEVAGSEHPYVEGFDDQLLAIGASCQYFPRPRAACLKPRQTPRCPIPFLLPTSPT